MSVPSPMIAALSHVADDTPVWIDNYWQVRRQITQRAARKECLDLLLRRLVPGPVRLIIERDESLVRSDTKHLLDRLGSLGLRETMSFELIPARQDPGLWVADAIAWAERYSAVGVCW